MRSGLGFLRYDGLRCGGHFGKPGNPRVSRRRRRDESSTCESSGDAERSSPIRTSSTWRCRNRLSPGEAIFIGDTPYDARRRSAVVRLSRFAASDGGAIARSAAPWHNDEPRIS